MCSGPTPYIECRNEVPIHPNGMVLISGFADSQAEAQEMAAIARSVSGVKGVKEEFVLKGGRIHQ